MLDASVSQLVCELCHKTQKFPFPVFTDFVKKNRENVLIHFFQFKMGCDGKKPLKTVITNFYKLHMNKGNKYTFKNFKKFSVHRSIDG